MPLIVDVVVLFAFVYDVAVRVSTRYDVDEAVQHAAREVVLLKRHLRLVRASLP